MQRILQKPFHPFLFAVFPLLFLYNSNHGHLSTGRIVFPVMISLGTTVILYVILRKFPRDPFKGPLILSLCLGVFYSYGHLSGLVENFLGHIPLLGIVLAVTVFLVYQIIKSSGPFVKTHAFLNFFSLILLVVAIPQTVFHSISDSHKQKKLLTLYGTGMFRPGMESGKIKRDIYYLIIDGHGRRDILKKMYHFDNSEFLEGLRERGFYVAPGSYANYMQTTLSLASSLNFTYLDRLSAELGRHSRNRLPLKTLIQNGRIIRILKQMDYTIEAYASEYSITNMTGADRLISPGKWFSDDEFDHLFRNTTLICALDHLFGSLPGGKKSESWARNRLLTLSHKRHIRHVLFTLRDLPHPRKSDAPRFTFAHVICPHPPFVFDRDGNINSKALLRRFNFHDGNHLKKSGKKLKRAYYVANYVEQLIFMESEILKTIDRILSQPGPKPVIILQSDHGPGSKLHWNKFEKTNNKERLAILNAYYLPEGGDQHLYEGISPVNTFPLILNHYFRQDIPLQEDRFYYSKWFTPFKFFHYRPE